MLAKIAEDRALLAEIKAQEAVAKEKSDACAERIRENRATHERLTALYDDAFHHCCETREVMKKIKRRAGTRGGGTELFMATGHSAKSIDRSNLMGIVTSASMGEMKSLNLSINAKLPGGRGSRSGSRQKYQSPRA